MPSQDIMAGEKVINIYPLENYTFGVKDAKVEKDSSVAERMIRLKHKSDSWAHAPSPPPPCSLPALSSSLLVTLCSAVAPSAPQLHSLLRSCTLWSAVAPSAPFSYPLLHSCPVAFGPSSNTST